MRTCTQLWRVAIEVEGGSSKLEPQGPGVGATTRFADQDDEAILAIVHPARCERTLVVSHERYGHLVGEREPSNMALGRGEDAGEAVA
jgi:hypothetical protein